jgi:hypothetical protein
MGYVSDSELRVRGSIPPPPNKAHCLTARHKLTGFSLIGRAICLYTTYVILAECMCTLDGRVSMFA